MKTRHKTPSSASGRNSLSPTAAKAPALHKPRREEQSLRDSELRYRLIFESNPCPMYIFDEQTLHFLDVNAAALRLYGYSREAFLAMTVKHTRPPEDMPAVLAAIRTQRRLLRRGTAVDGRRVLHGPGESIPLSPGEWRHVKRDGTVFDAAVTVSAIPYAGREARLVLVNDITARKQAEKELRQSREKYQALAENSPDIIDRFDRDYRHLYINPAGARLHGVPAQAIVGKNIAETGVPEPHRNLWEERIRRAFEDGHGAEIEDDFPTPEGKRHFQSRVVPELTSDGNVASVLVISRDVTDRKQAEEALQHRLAVEQLLAAASSRLVNVPTANLDATVNDVLADVGRLIGVDRCYLFRVADDLAVADNTHEWCAPGIRSQIADLRNLPTAMLGWMLERMHDGEPLCIPRVADIPPEAAAERQLIALGHVQSVLLVPIRHGGQLTGLIGCDAVRAERHWPDTDVRLLRIVGEILADAQVRCRADEAMRNAAREWQVTFDGVADAGFVLDAQQRILRCNNASTVLFGRSVEKMVGRHCWEIVHGTRQPIPECPVARMMRSRKRESMELAMDGRWYQVVVDPLIDANGELYGAVHAVSDITARKQAEAALRNMAAELERRVEERTAALRESTKRLEMTLAAAHVVAWELDPASGILLENGPVAEFFGRPKGFRHRSNAVFFKSVHPDDRTLVRAQVERALQSDSTDHAAEFRLLLPDGGVRWVASFGSVERDAAGRPMRLRGISRDITARKEAEFALARTHRALRVLTEGNRALLRATGEQELLNEACRIAIEVGGYQMAWVGYAEHDVRKSVRPMAQVGIVKDDLSRVIRTWADTKFGRGPTGVAIRTGQPCVCRNIAKDPLFTLWRREALRRGYVSALALPLLTEQGCLGALSIYSAQPDAFDDSEIQLLQQLANDLSFSIMALRSRLEQTELEQQVLGISEREQRRLGQDLHDGVGQSIIGINYLIGALQQSLVSKSAPEAAEVRKIAQKVAKTMREAHDLAQGLFPGELRRGRITDALQQLAIHTQDLFGIACRFTGLTGVQLTDTNVASQVYRIAQEAVNNAAKHSKGRSIEVRLSRSHGRLVLTVRDTGVGITRTAGKAAGMGQRIMKYRADMIGATLKIEGARGAGTTVTCMLPLPCIRRHT